MEKILLAVGFRQLEDFLEKQLKKEFMFVGTTVYREGIIRAVGQKNPDIIIIRETLEGKENIMTIIYELRKKFPKLRIVFIAGKREPGDALLATLVNYGVYDVLQGEKIKAQEVVGLIRKKNEYKDVQHLQPVPVLDEQRNQVLFQAPNTIIQEREVIKEIYIEQTIQNPASTPQKEAVTPAFKKKEEPMRVTEQDIVPEAISVIPAKAVVTIAKEEPFIKTGEVLKEEEIPNKKIHADKEVIQKKSKEDENYQNLLTSKQKIVTFIGSKNGVGNTSIALNTAVGLAQKGLKTIYIEFDEKTPSASYWYELGHMEAGIDTALLALEKNSGFNKIEEAIIKGEGLKNVKSMMQKNYKKFPKTLDFMFYSKKYLTKELEDEISIDMRLSKELFLHLMFQLEYDFIILDVPCDIHHPTTISAMNYSNKVFMTVTQDVSTIGYSLYKLNELSKYGINLGKKLYYIINQFEKTDLSLKEIQDWIQVKNLLTVPILNKDFVNANFIGLPVTMYSKNAELKTAFKEIEKNLI